jgi:hypothetical protein
LDRGEGERNGETHGAVCKTNGAVCEVYDPFGSIERPIYNFNGRGGHCMNTVSDSAGGSASGKNWGKGDKGCDRRKGLH